MSSFALRVPALRCRDSAHHETHVRASAFQERFRLAKYREEAGAEAETNPAEDPEAMSSRSRVLQELCLRLSWARQRRTGPQCGFVHLATALLRARSMFCSKARPKVPRLGPSPFVRSAFRSVESRTHSAVSTPARKPKRAMVQDLPDRARPGS